MERYKDVNGDSGVVGYELGVGYIRIQFLTGAIYLYTNESAGMANIEQMKRLAENGDGLNAFVNTTVRKRYAKKER